MTQSIALSPKLLLGIFLAFTGTMQGRTLRYFLCLGVLVLIASVTCAQQSAALTPPAVVSPADKAALQLFEKQVNDYIELRKKVRASAPKLSKDSTPEQINAYRTALEESMRNARAGAKRGELFRPEMADYIR